MGLSAIFFNCFASCNYWPMCKLFFPNYTQTYGYLYIVCVRYGEVNYEPKASEMSRNISSEMSV